MKKITVLLLLVFSLPLFAVSFGYDVAYEGFSIDKNSHNGLAINFDVDLLSNRSLNIEGGVKFGFDKDRFGFMGFEVLAGCSPFNFLNHPLTFMFANRTLLSPEIKAGISSYRDHAVLVRVGISPIHLKDVNFTYDFLAPFVLFNFDGMKYEGWGIELIRATYYFN